jgi:hypothetical protein
MQELITLDFTDTVRTIKMDESNEKYSVTFMQQAAFYYVDKNNEQVIETLKNSQEEDLEVDVTYDIEEMQIISAEMSA